MTPVAHVDHCPACGGEEQSYDGHPCALERHEADPTPMYCEECSHHWIRGE